MRPPRRFFTAGRRPGPDRELLEHRLRAALDAQAGTVGFRDLRHASPPSVSTAKGPWPPVRGAALVLLGLAAAVAAVLLVPGEPRQEGPAERPDPSVSRPHSPEPASPDLPAVPAVPAVPVPDRP
ncbi:hypothetical protein ACIOJD_22880 [Streptomyces sp. NPDC088116]|uniref:hypothetical protein n=1 Tax=Streptomyces sp. NPDC088116 TaxID=3365825 RepID=UPI0038187E2A